MLIYLYSDLDMQHLLMYCKYHVLNINNVIDIKTDKLFKSLFYTDELTANNI